MAEPPEIEHLLVSPDQMQALWNQHREMLSRCRETREPDHQSPEHEGYCCKKEKIILSHPETGEIYALSIEQTFVNPAKGKNIVRRQIRIGNKVYNLRLPK
jgi:hypothetical protein